LAWELESDIFCHVEVYFSTVGGARYVAGGVWYYGNEELTRRRWTRERQSRRQHIRGHSLGGPYARSKQHLRCQARTLRIPCSIVVVVDHVAIRLACRLRLRSLRQKQLAGDTWELVEVLDICPLPLLGNTPTCTGVGLSNSISFGSLEE